MAILVTLPKKQRPKLNSQINPLQIFSITLLMIHLSRIIISKVNKNKSTGSISLRIKILKLFKYDISSQLADIFNVSFSSGTTPCQIIPTHKRESKLICSNYRTISLLSNFDEILEKLMYSRVCDFLDKSRLISYLNVAFRQDYPNSYAILI